MKKFTCISIFGLGTGLGATITAEEWIAIIGLIITILNIILEILRRYHGKESSD